MTRNARDDFDNPRVPRGSRLVRHVLYRLTRAQFARGGGAEAPDGDRGLP